MSTERQGAFDDEVAKNIAANKSRSHRFGLHDGFEICFDCGKKKDEVRKPDAYDDLFFPCKGFI